MDYTAQGDTTNLAARLQAMAPLGGVLISEQTYRHIEGHFNCQDLGAIQVKGRSQPVHIYQATGVRKWRGLLDEAEGRYLARLVGRDRELYFLQGLLERAKRGQGQVASVLSEPGMGKNQTGLRAQEGPRRRGCGIPGRGLSLLWPGHRLPAFHRLAEGEL